MTPCPHWRVNAFFILQEILKRYGYLRCGSSKRRASASRHKEGRHGGRRCTSEEIRNAIRRYQNTYNMPVTGQLDEATLRLMSESRCGNPDDESRAARFKPMIHPRKRHWRKGHSYQPLGRHRRDISYEAETTEEYRPNQLSDAGNIIDFPEAAFSEESQDLEVLRQRLSSADDGSTSDQKSPAKQSHQKVLPVHELVLGDKRVSTEDPLPPGTSVTRRKRWLERYLKDLESGQLDKRLEEQYEKMKARRRKRSVASGVEGQSFTNEIVTWRLIGSAYSNQLTVNIQRAALALAFRMWGEVIPLVFQEDTRSPVDDVDVLIAFGR
ncbi:Matrix metalloproteinase-21, partial [Araneus ventricosus]